MGHRSNQGQLEMPGKLPRGEIWIGCLGLFFRVEWLRLCLGIQACLP